ncbi:MAG: DUF350 domain-containing protein [Euzebya sp.]
MIVDVLVGAAQGLAFAAIGLGLMALGFVVVDVLTPGKLGQILIEGRNRNAAMLVVSGTLSVAGIVVVAIATSSNDFGRGLVDTAVFGLVGIGLMGLAFVVADALTPGRLRDIVLDDIPHPAVYVVMASHVGVAAIVSASIA